MFTVTPNISDKIKLMHIIIQDLLKGTKGLKVCGGFSALQAKLENKLE